jgi:ankyrin repeat protein
MTGVWISMSNVAPIKLKEVIHKALLSGDARTVKSCLDDGFNVDGRLLQRKGRPQRETPLIIAAELGNVSMAKLLIGRGADVNAEAEFHITALVNAITFNHPTIVNLLLKSGAEIKAECLIHAATTKIDLRITRFLLRYGADPNAQNKSFRQAAIHMAAFHDRTDVARLLIRAGADINISDKHGHGPISNAISHNSKAMFSLLLKADTEPSLQPEALGLAAWDGRLPYVKGLIEHGWDVNSKAFKGRTALQHARNRKHSSIVKALLEAGALR